MTDYDLKDFLQHSILKSIKVSWTILVIMIPISLGMTILQYTGGLKYISWILTPVMKLVSLPGEASFALIVGALINIYAGIAVMVTLGLDAWSINIIAVMMLICHNLVVESAVQAKTGVSGFKMTTFRIIAAVGMGFCVSLLLPVELKNAGTSLTNVLPSSAQGFSEILLQWFRQTSILTLKVICIIAGINLLLDIMRYFKAFDLVISLLRPLTFVNGLPPKTSFMWIAGILFGLAYGSGVLISEARTGNVDKDALVRLNLSLGISHALLEDTLLFVAIGASLFWVLVPRIVAAALMVWLYAITRSFFAMKRQG
ncbi:MAG: nucleoside recognition domain-containing protein [Desulfomonilia bacterium]